MSYSQQYLGRSHLSEAAGGQQLSLSPNLARDKVFFEGEIKHPLRFREAMSALHEVVVGDLKAKPRDRSAWEAYKVELAAREARILQTASNQRELEALRETSEPPPKDLKQRFRDAHAKYFGARARWLRELHERDSKLWWLLDPIVTAAPDAVLFECFSLDESSYACLAVDREAFSRQDHSNQGLGTTNVDYSWALYDQFQKLRSYRPTQLAVDPTGFEIDVSGSPAYREEKIDLPESWLRGFGQIQAAQMLPATALRLPRETVYGLLAVLKRRREKAGPRAIRFELAPGGRCRVVLEPWELEIKCPGRVHDADVEQTVRVWGRRRLEVLARLLPLIESVELRLLGDGLPSIWLARLGEMSFTLALSGWTNNDFTSGANLELLAGQLESVAEVEIAVARELREARLLNLSQLNQRIGTHVPRHLITSALFQLALRGQAIYDYAHRVYRFRQVLPEAIAVDLARVNPELEAARRALREGNVRLERSEDVGNLRLLLAGMVGGTKCEALVDADGVFKKGQCNCSFFFKNRLRRGPCRHLLALKLKASPPTLGGASPVRVVP
ncbi:MAG TPA: SWIM zinc finger family protein [Polyangiaceae bacterium]|nr:SWIM zinc finger family protein [Polyangiaceae bacterium]